MQDKVKFIGECCSYNAKAIENDQHIIILDIRKVMVSLCLDKIALLEASIEDVSDYLQKNVDKPLHMLTSCTEKFITSPGEEGGVHVRIYPKDYDHWELWVHVLNGLYVTGEEYDACYES